MQARLGEFTTHPTDSPTIVQFAANQVLHPSGPCIFLPVLKTSIIPALVFAWQPHFQVHHFAGCAELVAGHARGIDLNCGCPQVLTQLLLFNKNRLNIINLCVQRWAVKEGIGACLIDKPEFVADVVRSKHLQESSLH